MRKSYMQFKQSQKGFTLIELLLVIAIIAILAAVIFVALDPLKRFADSRDSTRWSETEELLHAIKIDQIDNRGEYLQAIQDIAPDTWYMIGAASTTLFTATSTNCETLCDGVDGDFDVGTTTDCIDLTDLVTEGYLPMVPISPNNPNHADWSADFTGYVIKKTNIAGITPGEGGGSAYLTVGACEGENDDIAVQR